MPGFRARAPLSLVVSGDEVAALGALVDAGTVTLALEERATVSVSVREPAEWRARIRGLGRTLLVEPDLPAPGDEGALAVEAHGLREWTRASAFEQALDVTVECRDAPDLGSLEARADALAACLDGVGRAGGSRAQRGKRAAAARAGSPSGVLLGNAPRNRASVEVARALADRLLLARDRHAPTGPSARLALIAWHSGDPRKRVALERAARISRAAAEVAWGEGLGPLPELVAEEARALEAIAPRAEREQRLEAELVRAGASVIRRLGERGLMALLVKSKAELPPLLERARELNLETIPWRPGSAEVEVEEVTG